MRLGDENDGAQVSNSNAKVAGISVFTLSHGRG